MDFEQEIKQLLKRHTGLKKIILEIPPNSELGDLSFPCFKLSKKLPKVSSKTPTKMERTEAERQKKPNEIAQKLFKKITEGLAEGLDRSGENRSGEEKPNFVKEIKVTGPYLNFFIDYKLLAPQILTKIFKEKDSYGKSKIGKNKKIVLDYSAPNIAKPFSIGHLRSTIIGQALYNIFNFLGYKSIGVNHLGDWGTQFGKLIYAYKKWGNGAELKKNPVKYLLSLYIKFHEEAEKNDDLNEKAREEFKKLENKNPQVKKLWKKFSQLSLKEFNKIYKILNINIDYNTGESFYNDKLEKAVQKVKEKIALKKSQGALIVDLEKYKMPPVLLKKSNSTSTYHTRDLATAFYRLKKFKPEKILYVVGSEQKLHFEQLFKVLDLMGLNNNKFVHVDFGLFRFSEGKMSTRQGKIIFLEDVINKSIKLATKIINEKNPNLENKKNIAKKVGIGSLIFGDLKNDRTKNIKFNWDKILSFDGETGAYLQYTYARSCSIFKKAKIKPNLKVDFSLLKEKEELAIIKRLHSFSDSLIRVSETYQPYHLAQYLIELAKEYNEFYNNCKVINKDKEIMKLRLLLIFSVKQVLANGLKLLGIEVVDEM